MGAKPKETNLYFPPFTVEAAISRLAVRSSGQLRDPSRGEALGTRRLRRHGLPRDTLKDVSVNDSFRRCSQGHRDA